MAANSSLIAIPFSRIKLVSPQRKYELKSEMKTGRCSANCSIQFMTNCHDLYLNCIWFVFEL